MKVIGYIGLVITFVSAIIWLCKVVGLISSPSFESIVGSFIVGQIFFNVYAVGRLEFLASAPKKRRKK